MNPKDTFRLIFIQKSDGVKFLGKRLVNTDYVLFNTETGEKLTLTRGKLRSRFQSGKNNYEYRFGEKEKKLHAEKIKRALRRSKEFSSEANPA